eukprot:TRINITY_DN743_c0_g2_i1.p1 TRINITY_DN743_c0_g2~~TRINITY_DN743_c0_g2_i1.p1  ORF type:complete len:193 (-),score=72.71 TRINITY_DN743_c0_g2_i1:93-614(-)
MVLLTNEQFSIQLRQLYANCRTKRSVFLTFKRVQVPDAPIQKEGKMKRAEAALQADPRCLIRATDGKTKISTLVNESDAVNFRLILSQIQKSSMDGLNTEIVRQKLNNKPKPKSKPKTGTTKTATTSTTTATTATATATVTTSTGTTTTGAIKTGTNTTLTNQKTKKKKTKAQ